MNLTKLTIVPYVVCAFAILNLSLNAQDSDPSDSDEETKLKQLQTENRLNYIEAQSQELEERLLTLQRRYDELLSNDVPTLRPRSLENFFARFLPTRDDVTKGFIGVFFEETATSNGIQIVEVVDGAPADIAGIKAGDLLTKIGEDEVAEFDKPIESAVASINSNPPGSIIRLTLSREGEKLNIDVATVRRATIGFNETSQYRMPQTLHNIRDRLGSMFQLEFDRFANTVHVIDIDEDFGRYFGTKSGVLVLAVDEVEGIQQGDVLLKIDDQTITTVSDAIQRIREAAEEVTIVVKRNKREKSITLAKDQFILNHLLD